MTLDVAGVLADAWGNFKRDRDLLIRVAGVFLFLPTYGLYLAVPAPPGMAAKNGSEAEQLAWINAYADWAASNGGWYLLASFMIYLGTLALVTLYADPARPDLRQALARAARLFPRYIAAVLVMSIPAGLGLLLFLLPGLYVLGRMVAIGPALVAEQPMAAMASIRRSLALTRGNGLILMGFAALTLVGGGLLAEPFMALDRVLRGAPDASPLAIAAVDAAAALMTTVSLLATALFQVAIYRRLAQASRGI